MSNDQQRSSIRKSRERDPIVDVFMYNMPSRCYAVSVPPSKSWLPFTDKIRNKFKLSASSTIRLYRAPNGQSDLDNLQEYDLDNTNMAKIKHKFVLCAKEVDIESDSDSQHEQQDNELKQENDSDVVSGLDLDIFGRFHISKKPPKSKKRVYHFHRHAVVEKLCFNVKETWLTLKSQPMTVQHIDEKYSTMQDQQKQFTLTLRRMIWPKNLQHRNDSFEYKLDDMVSTWKWCIMLVHGGKFAGAVYHGQQMAMHKTLSRYVTRSKQGRRQVNYRSVSGIKSVGSAGGFKRDVNEKKLLQEIRDILYAWMDEIGECHKIFVHCPGAYNQMTVFGSSEEQNQLYPQTGNGELNDTLSKERLLEIKHKKKSLYRFYKKDERIMQIPITTNKVNLQEVERVHHWLSTCWLAQN